MAIVTSRAVDASGLWMPEARAGHAYPMWQQGNLNCKEEPDQMRDIT